MLDIDKVTQINEKYIFYNGERLKMDEKQLFEIMVVCMELRNSYTQAIPAMRDEYDRALEHLSTMKCMPESKFFNGVTIDNLADYGDMLKVVEYRGYVDGIRTALNTLYHKREHCITIFKQANWVYSKL